MASDGLRDFQYDAAHRFSKVRIFKGGEAASVVADVDRRKKPCN